MKIGIISDSHDNLTNLEKAFVILNNQKVELVFFGGDLSAPFVVGYFKKIRCPVKAVFGNNEGDKINILRKIEVNKLEIDYASKQGLMWDLVLANKRIAVFHGHQAEITDCLVNSGLYDFVFTGHVHESWIKKVAKTLWINPGCVCGWTGLGAISAKASLAILDLKTGKAKIIFI